MNNPFHGPLPITVYLRNCQLATVERLDGGAGFPLFGRIQVEGSGPECWRADGCWRENGSKHPLDIVGEITGQQAETGKLIMVPYAPAAGVKGPKS